MAESPTRHIAASNLRRAAFFALAGSVVLVLLSIAASEILLAFAVGFAALLWIREEHLWRRLPPAVLPASLFILWTIIAAAFSPDPLNGLKITKKFFLFLILVVGPFMLKGKDSAVRVYRAIFCTAAIGALAGVAQYLANPNRDLLHRITGFMGHVMTFSGLLMLVLVALAAYVMSIGLGKGAWTVPLGLLLIASLAMSLTRNAWVGATVGLVVVLALARPKALGGLALILVAMLLLSPGKIQQRIRTGFNPSDDNTRNRIELFETSLRLIRAHPWLGAGPKNVGKAALQYRGSNEWPDWMYQHMHNNFLQIAAERGLPGLALWLWFMGRLAWDAWKVRRAAAQRRIPGQAHPTPNEALFVSTAALGSWAALLVAGMAEYNFGDSEVLILFMFIMAAPYAFPDGAPGSSVTTDRSIP